MLIVVYDVIGAHQPHQPPSASSSYPTGLKPLFVSDETFNEI